MIHRSELTVIAIARLQNVSYLLFLDRTCIQILIKLNGTITVPIS